MDLRPVDLIIEKHQEKRTALISILHEVQDRYRYLPEEALRMVASRLRMDINEVYGVATFYKSFTLIPKGRHSITLCTGTACHVRGGQAILREIKNFLNIEPGQITPDREISLDGVNCMGVCAIGPVIKVNQKFYGTMSPFRAKKIIERLKNKRSGVKG